MRRLAMLPSNARPPAQPRVERLAGILVVVSACTLETLPIFCWLLLLAAYDSGDHLHPSDAGYKAMGEAIDLTLFRARRP